MRFVPHIMLKAVLDTNVIISGLHRTAISPPTMLLKAWQQQKFILVTSPAILTEVQEVLLRPSIAHFLAFSRQDTKDILTDLQERAFITAGTYLIDAVPKDAEDNMFLAAALEGEATHLVTGDEKHLLPLKQYHGVTIVRPALFLATLENSRAK
jgi:uncharacterized protein